MKTQIKKIIILVCVLFFVAASTSFAHDWKRGHHKPPGHAYGHYKKGHGHHIYWHGPRHHLRRHYYYKVVPEHHHYHHYERYPEHSAFFLGFSVYEPDYAVSVGVKEYD
jgi:hypothetical protein